MRDNAKEKPEASVASIGLLEIHKCMDDMLVLCMPEEFDRPKRDEVAIRVMKNGGRLAYISNHLDALADMISSSAIYVKVRKVG